MLKGILFHMNGILPKRSTVAIVRNIVGVATAAEKLIETRIETPDHLTIARNPSMQ